MERRWTSIMHDEVAIYEELESPESPTWHLLGSVKRLDDGTFQPTVGRKRVPVSFSDWWEARALVEQRLRAVRDAAAGAEHEEAAVHREPSLV